MATVSTDAVSLIAGPTSTLATECLLAEPEACKHLNKLEHSEEWAESIRQSHPDNEQCAACLQQFWLEINLLREKFDHVVPGGCVLTWLALQRTSGAPELKFF